MSNHVAIVSGLVLEKNKNGEPISLAVDLDIIYDVFKIISAWKAMQEYLGKDLNIKKSINNLKEITFGSILVEFKKSIGDDILLIPSMSENEDKESLLREIKDYIEVEN
jgi:hypothetical protein